MRRGELSPCLRCDNHSPICHSGCQKYEQFVVRRRAMKEQIAKAKRSEDDYVEFKRKSVSIAKRGKSR